MRRFVDITWGSYGKAWTLHLYQTSSYISVVLNTMFPSHDPWVTEKGVDYDNTAALIENLDRDWETKLALCFNKGLKSLGESVLIFCPVWALPPLHAIPILGLPFLNRLLKAFTPPDRDWET